MGPGLAAGAFLDEGAAVAFVWGATAPALARSATRKDWPALGGESGVWSHSNTGPAQTRTPETRPKQRPNHGEGARWLMRI